MVIACVPGSERGKLGSFNIDEESVEQDYEQDSKVPRPIFMHMTHEGL